MKMDTLRVNGFPDFHVLLHLLDHFGGRIERYDYLNPNILVRNEREGMNISNRTI